MLADPRRILAAACVLAATLLGSGTAAGGTQSLIELPIELDLRPLFQAADEFLPREAGHWQSWRDWHGIQTRYRAWRGPLSLSLAGDVLQAQAHVRYWAQARKHVIGRLDLSAGCGVDEPPRQALIGLLAHLGFAGDWTLHPSFRVLPPRFLDRCEVTVLGIDVTPILGEVFEDQLEEALGRAMDGLRPRLAELRGEAARLWDALQDPTEIVPGLWLSGSPRGVALAPPVGRGDRLTTTLGLAMDLRVDAERPTAVVKRPLPPLQPFLPSGRGLRFDLSLALDYDALGDALARHLAGRSIDVEGRQVQIAGVRLAAKDGDLQIQATLTGAAPGRLTIMAKPVWDAAVGQVRLADLGFVFDAEDPDQGLAADLYYERIRSALDTAANDLLQGRMGQIRGGLEAALPRVLGRALGPGAEVKLSGVGLQDLSIQVLDAGLRLTGSAGGELRVSSAGRDGSGR